MDAALLVVAPALDAFPLESPLIAEAFSPAGGQSKAGFLLLVVFFSGLTECLTNVLQRCPNRVKQVAKTILLELAAGHQRTYGVRDSKSCEVKEHQYLERV